MLINRIPVTHVFTEDNKIKHVCSWNGKTYEIDGTGWPLGFFITGERYPGDNKKPVSIDRYRYHGDTKSKVIEILNKSRIIPS